MKMLRTTVIVQARMSSSRLPGKVLMPLSHMPVLGWVARAAHAIGGADSVIIATSREASDDPVAQWCEAHGEHCYRGSLEDVLGRYAAAARRDAADVVMRLTADCPLLDPIVCAQVLSPVQKGEADISCNAHPRTWPKGLDCEAFTRQALEIADSEARAAEEREHVTPFLYAHPTRFRRNNVAALLAGLEMQRWTLDYPADYAFLQQVAAHLPVDRCPSYTEVLDVIKRQGLTHPLAGT